MKKPGASIYNKLITSFLHGRRFRLYISSKENHTQSEKGKRRENRKL